MRAGPTLVRRFMVRSYVLAAFMIGGVAAQNLQVVTGSVVDRRMLRSRPSKCSLYERGLRVRYKLARTAPFDLTACYRPSMSCKSHSRDLTPCDDEFASLLTGVCRWPFNCRCHSTERR